MNIKFSLLFMITFLLVTNIIYNYEKKYKFTIIILKINNTYNK